MRTLRDTFLAEVEAYIEAHNMPPTTFGIRAMNDRHFLLRLRGGKDVRSSTIDKVRRWMADHPLARSRAAKARCAQPRRAA